jgi:hypothetical protein
MGLRDEPARQSGEERRGQDLNDRCASLPIRLDRVRPRLGIIESALAGVGGGIAIVERILDPVGHCPPGMPAITTGVPTEIASVNVNGKPPSDRLGLTASTASR